MSKEFKRFGIPQFQKLTGMLQILGGLALLIGSWKFPLLAFIGAAGLALLMLLGSVVRIKIKPKSARQGLYTPNSTYWATLNQGTWDFQASEGYVTFRIVGSEKEVSKKFATVIPENSSGNVDIILEQSTDLINWSAVNPGSFPPSTAKRFFRVRSQE